MLPILLAGLTLGLAGSIHCIGMCGPLSLALPTLHLSKRMRFISILLYQLGRIITYASLGLIFGLLGRGFYIAGIQQWVSVIIGSLILILAGLYFIRRYTIQVTFLHSFFTGLQRLMSRLMKTDAGIRGFLLLGITNGLLPCGMVYIAIATTLSYSQLLQSVSFMACFGVGTLPAMLVVAYSKQWLRPQSKVLFRRAVPYVIALAGVLLILRGLNLGITFISPQLTQTTTGSALNCH
ncbi:MAG: sulfite exporter TauE/SafE family protein [Chitinophagaceae bacterium]